MEEFIENFQKFRTWLYSKRNSCDETYAKIISKFEELELHEAF